MFSNSVCVSSCIFRTLLKYVMVISDSETVFVIPEFVMGTRFNQWNHINNVSHITVHFRFPSDDYAVTAAASTQLQSCNQDYCCNCCLEIPFLINSPPATLPGLISASAAGRNCLAVSGVTSRIRSSFLILRSISCRGHKPSFLLFLVRRMIYLEEFIHEMTLAWCFYVASHVSSFSVDDFGILLIVMLSFLSLGTKEDIFLLMLNSHVSPDTEMAFLSVYKG